MIVKLVDVKNNKCKAMKSFIVVIKDSRNGGVTKIRLYALYVMIKLLTWNQFKLVAQEVI